MNMTLYDKIFSVANVKMQEDGQNFSFSQTAFRSILYKNPNEIHVDEFNDMCPKDFIDSLYLRCLNRLPDTSAYRYLVKVSSADQLEANCEKYVLLVNISRSAEFRSTDKSLIGLEEMRTVLWEKGSKAIRWKIKRAESGAGIKGIIKKYFVYPVWRCLPKRVKDVIRTMIKREKR